MAKIKHQDTTTFKKGVENLLSLSDAFRVYINALKAAGRSYRTIAVYEQSFEIYNKFFYDQHADHFGDLDANLIRELLN